MSETIREIVAVFDDTEALDSAVYALETRGFDRAAFSLLASEAAVAKKLGHRYQQVKEVEDDPNVPRGTFFRGSQGWRWTICMLPSSHRSEPSRSSGSEPFCPS